MILGSAALVAGHGYVSGAVVDGTYYGGYLVDQYPYSSDPPDVIAWSEDATDLGFIDGTGYSSPNIICHKNAKPGASSAPVKAGGSVELQWTEWPESHHGPVITYLANCNGDCSTVDKTTLKFFKIDEGGLIDDSNVPGTWASDNLISNNNSRTITIPSTIEPGNYVLRHEIIALHSAGNKNGAQNYPQCFNLKVTGGGSDSPSGTLGTELYKDTDPGILANIYTSLSSYPIPGPALYTGGASGPDTSAQTSSSTATTSAPTTTVSVSPLRSPSSTPYHRSSTRVPLPRPTTSRNPGPSGPQFTQPTGPQNPPAAATSTVTESATAQVTDQPVFQTPSGEPDTVAATASPGNQSAQSAASNNGDEGSSSSSSPSSSNLSGSSGSGATTVTAGSGSASGASEYNSSDWSSYLSSLSADQVLSLLKQTFKWMVTDKKHARDLSN